MLTCIFAATTPGQVVRIRLSKGLCNGAVLPHYDVLYRPTEIYGVLKAPVFE